MSSSIEVQNVSSCNRKECRLCSHDVASWMPIPIDCGKEDIDINKEHVKYYTDLIVEFKKICKAYHVEFEQLIKTESLPNILYLEIKEQLEYYHSLFENFEEMDDFYDEEL